MQSKIKIDGYAKQETSSKNSIKVEKIQMNGLAKKPYSSEHQIQQVDTDISYYSNVDEIQEKSSSHIKIEQFLSYLSTQKQDEIFQAYRAEVDENQVIRQKLILQQEYKLQFQEKYKQVKIERQRLEKLNQELKSQIIEFQKKLPQQGTNEIEELRKQLFQKEQAINTLYDQKQQQRKYIYKLREQVEKLQQTVKNSQETVKKLQVTVKQGNQRYEKYKKEAISKMAQARRKLEQKVGQRGQASQRIEIMSIQLQQKDNAIKCYQQQVIKYQQQIQYLRQITEHQRKSSDLYSQPKNIQSQNIVGIRADDQALRLGLYQVSMPIQLKEHHLLERQKKLKRLAEQLYLLAQRVENANNIAF